MTKGEAGIAVFVMLVVLASLVGCRSIPSNETKIIRNSFGQGVVLEVGTP